MPIPLCTHDNPPITDAVGADDQVNSWTITGTFILWSIQVAQTCAIDLQSWKFHDATPGSWIDETIFAAKAPQYADNRVRYHIDSTPLLVTKTRDTRRITNREAMPLRSYACDLSPTIYRETLDNAGADIAGQQVSAIQTFHLLFPLGAFNRRPS